MIIDKNYRKNAHVKTRKERPLLTWVVDTREQLPYHFSKPRREFDDGGTLSYALDAGDYSVELDGELLPIRIERKSLVDFLGVVGRGRDRFERELERLQGFTSYLLIEASADEVKAGCNRSLVSGNAALASAICWSQKFGINPIFASNRRIGQEICQRLLEEFCLHQAHPKR